MAIIEGKPHATVYGTRGDDDITLAGNGNAYGGYGNDSIYGSDGNNKIYGQDGDDAISTGDSGRDSVWGGRGDDIIVAQYSSSATLYGEAGNDTIYGSFGNDVIDGGAGDDWLGTWGGRDRLRGGTGDDTFVWLDDEDTSASGVSNFSGGAGRDTLFVVAASGDGIDRVEITITGEGKGELSYQSDLVEQDGKRLDFTGINAIRNDDYETAPLTYRGGNSDNTVTGGGGEDQFVGGQGDEVFTGGDGNDSFVFDFRPATAGGMGHDRITDFSLDPDWNTDTLQFRDGEGRMTTTKVEHDGITTYTSTDNVGRVIHVLDVETIGLPPVYDDSLLG
jgi:Ca2+-binding RTX toxin-like protein